MKTLTLLGELGAAACLTALFASAYTDLNRKIDDKGKDLLSHGHPCSGVYDMATIFGTISSVHLKKCETRGDDINVVYSIKTPNGREYLEHNTFGALHASLAK